MLVKESVMGSIIKIWGDNLKKKSEWDTIMNVLSDNFSRVIKLGPINIPLHLFEIEAVPTRFFGPST
jgi:hypothetical protein